ncbi:uncharacterized protein ACA1_076520 [Acanthamoeba castellanii str. Neff]|uniref:Uncharacterized protein n=1 Tax=Acanthamoeba castellanii (strain ATCC 30010 / Neff) TaxID=1257118 RepID=L8GLT3_ACACF|nr:uncharacterized protein ACA1_076520 [Acanthamoeba castellanii str. Neff]ELR13799.1 hypothetical protein ACA1_076520 [Acanthamoeba castellanii str. Neff]
MDNNCEIDKDAKLIVKGKACMSNVKQAKGSLSVVVGGGCNDEVVRKVFDNFMASGAVPNVFTELVSSSKKQPPQL